MKQFIQELERQSTELKKDLNELESHPMHNLFVTDDEGVEQARNEKALDHANDEKI